MNSPTENSELNSTINPVPDKQIIDGNIDEQLNAVNSETIDVPVDSIKNISEIDSNSADSDNESVNNCTIKNKKKHHFIDSDSEDESSNGPGTHLDPSPQLGSDPQLGPDPHLDPSPHPDPHPRSDPDPQLDSEKENLTPGESQEPQTPEPKKKSRLRKISDDSDSDNEMNKSGEISISPKEIRKVNESVLTEKQNAEIQKSRLNELVDSDSEDESKLEEKIFNESVDEDALQKEQAIRLKNLCDSESSAEETEAQNIPEIKSKQIQKSRKKSAPSAEKKMTGRDAKEQMRQIKSESQKMVRESRVSLPYHLPKQHTLQEFLKRRSLVPDVIHVPVNNSCQSTTFAIKMSSQELVKAAELLKEREKEIEEFYKDESDDSENETIEENAQKESESVENKQEENNKTLDILQEIDSILELDKQPNEETPTTEVGVEVQSSEEPTADVNIISSEIPENEDTPDTEETSQTEAASKNEETSQTEAASKNEETSKTEEASKVEELRNVLIQFSCGNDSNLEQLVEEPEKMDLAEIPETTKEPEEKEEEDEVVELMEVEAPEKLSEDFIESHFTANLRSAEETIPQETPNKEDEIEKKLKNLNPILALKKDFTPRLTGDGGDFVVLDDGLERSKGVNNLMKRFLLHTASNKPTPKKDAPDAGATAHQETSAISIEMDHEPDEAAKKNLTPGLKFKKLKANLEEQIVLKRLEDWKKKQQEFNIEPGVVDGEKTECGAEDKILDDEDEEDISEEESSEDSEEEEDDIVLEDKPKAKSAFVDDEAEESEEDNIDGVSVAATAAADDDDDESNAESDSDSDADSGDDLMQEIAQKTLKRIIQVFDEDSDDEENKENCPEGNDEEITAYQPQGNGLEKTPLKTNTENKNDLSTFLTPTFHLTALQGMNSSTKSLHESPGIALSPDPSPLRMHPLLKTKLFTEPEDANLEDLENLCSGKFTGATQHPPQPAGNNKDLTMTQENALLNLCSGKFTGFTAESPQKSVSEAPEEDNQFQITFDNDSLDEKLSESTSDIRASQNSEKNTQDVLINAESEETKEIKESDETEETPRMEAMQLRNFLIASSDEEDENTETKEKNMKKGKTKKKYIIDDISISEDEDTANQDDFSDAEDEDEANVKNVNYDSEENEVEYEEMEGMEEMEEMGGGVDRVTVKKARDYFEAEAELSGSDWDSADEDEKGLDDFEAEDGDADKISEKKLQRELGRIHAHTVLEEDKRDVRLLQELLLEDGELHGAGREKKFKWKNADSATWNDENRPQDEEEDIEEAENELEWRKMRHEREMFLKEQQSKQQHEQEDEEILANDSQIMQLGREALEKSNSSSSQQSSQQKSSITESVLTDPDIKLPFVLTHKRGSFLTRSETTLARLAELTRTSSGALANGPKNSRNFVFTTVEKTDTTLVIEESSEKKRKAEPGTPKILKKMRVAESPAPQKNKKLF